jgi:hypothetical protein
LHGTKKRPSVVPAWIEPGLTSLRGEEPQSQEDWLPIIGTFLQISLRLRPCRKHIFWTGTNYRDRFRGAAGSIGYYLLDFHRNSLFHQGLFLPTSVWTSGNPGRIIRNIADFASLFALHEPLRILNA